MEDSQLIKDLESLDCEKVQPFSFAGIYTYAKVYRVIDADTIGVVFKLADNYTKLTVRLAGIDAPESRSKSKNEVNGSRIATSTLKKMINEKIVKIYFSEFDKYGRTLARVFMLEEIESGCDCVNDYLVMYQYAKIYTGGKKSRWTSEELARIGMRL